VLRKSRLYLFIGCLVLLLPTCAGEGGIDLSFQPLAFPLSNPGDVVRLAAFGIPNWSGSEPHNGIDLVIDENLASTGIVSPTAGQVTRISTEENPFSDPPGQLLLTIAIEVNSEWTVNLVLEPSTADPELRTAQLNAIGVSEGEEVMVGTPVADLLIGSLGYPHLHYMLIQNGQAVCAYPNSSAAAQEVFNQLAALPGSNLPDGNICFGQP
jgi:murein DD-endopeptidase MepM/ murein hydrolase activator NlpD